MTNSGFIAAMGSVAAAIFFVAAVICGMSPHTTTARVLFVVALVLSASYLFVSLFWGVRATMLEGYQVTKREDDD